MTRQNHSHYEQGAGEGLLVTRILLYLPRYKTRKIGAVKSVYRFFGVPFHATQLI
jgi:hypothetical protein